MKHLTDGAHATVWRVDEIHGSAVALFNKMGRPDSPSRQQIVQLREAGQLAAPEQLDMNHGELEISIPPQVLVVIELR